MPWRELEKNVREVAEKLWNRSAQSKVLCGVQIDCVVEIQADYVCLVEVTEEYDLQKVRNDITKLDTVSHGLLAQNIYSKKFIVLKKEPTKAMYEAGYSMQVEVISYTTFEKMWFNYNDYIYRRKGCAFGSVIDIESGLPESSSIYVPVYYYDSTGAKYTIDDIAKKLQQNAIIILKGGFGTGKSLCVKNLFDILSQVHEVKSVYTLAINLKEHWGAKDYRELIHRHLNDLSIESDNFYKVFDKPNIIYLLDGFDEMGTQSWSSDVDKLRMIRKHAVIGVRDLIQRSQGGCLITGREHYFNSDKEMIDCLGLKDKRVLILECREEFDEQQVKDYISKISNTQMEYLPHWLPKRPLIINIALKYMQDLFLANNAFDNECDFWNLFLNLLAKREAKINVALDDETIKNVMIRVARKTRIKAKDYGPVSIEELYQAFEEVTGERPTEESAIILHRLPGLGRVDADSTDRNFIDSYILNGLRAEDIINSVNNDLQSIMLENWTQPLNIEGLSILSNYVNSDIRRIKQMIGFAVRSCRKRNNVLAADIVSAISMVVDGEIDFNNIQVNEARFSRLDFSNKKIKNLHIRNSEIDDLDITNVGFDDTVIIQNCIISNIYGVSNSSGLPNVFQKCEYDNFQTISTISRIKRANLTRAQTILITIIKKIFSTVSKGNGRKEEALLRGLGEKGDSRICDKILNMMIKEDILNKHRGDDGWIYSPNLKHTSRMLKILSDLTNSHDVLWEYANSL